MCSHVAAVLFKVEACMRLEVASMTCTSLPCTYNQAFSKKVCITLIVTIQISPAPVSQIVFDRPKRSKDPPTVSPFQQRSTVEIQPTFNLPWKHYLMLCIEFIHQLLYSL